MSTDVDLRELAIDRGGTGEPRRRTRRHVLTRYVLPLALILGFLSLVAWASRDLIFPPKAVTVVPVYSTTAEVRQEGTPLFKAAGWIEPRPTPVRVAALAPGVVEMRRLINSTPCSTRLNFLIWARKFCGPCWSMLNSPPCGLPYYYR